MKVGFDISQIAHGGGVARYTQNLALELNQKKEMDMVYFYSSLRKPYTGKQDNVKQFKLPPTLLEILFNRIRVIPIEFFIGKIDIFHSSDWTQPPASAKKVTTYHDVIPLKYPQWSHPKIVDTHKRRLKLVEQEIDIVITVSKATQKDLLEVSKIPANKIVVIYEGVDERFKPQTEEDIQGFKKRLHLPDDFILAIGGVGERKNLTRVKQVAKGFKLIITGETIPTVSEDDLPLLYASARVLLYPSLYEGFGLPILEAMACGTPVITSNVSSLPEVGGEAAVYVDPEKTEDISNKLKLVMEDEGLRNKLVQKGLSQAKRFSWKRCAEETINVYKRIILP